MSSAFKDFNTIIRQYYYEKYINVDDKKRYENIITTIIIITQIIYSTQIISIHFKRDLNMFPTITELRLVFSELNNNNVSQNVYNLVIQGEMARWKGVFVTRLLQYIVNPLIRFSTKQNPYIETNYTYIYDLIIRSPKARITETS